MYVNYLLTPSWEANMFSASQEIPRILWNPNVHYRNHKLPPPVPILKYLFRCFAPMYQSRSEYYS